MGEIAESMLNGDMCEACGENLFDENGEPRESMRVPDYCSPECAVNRGADWWLKANGYDKAGKRMR